MLAPALQVPHGLGDELMVEVEARAEPDPADWIQSLSYLKGSGYRAGLLLNFRSPRLGIERLANRAHSEALRH